jgi:methyl-accepting chemotaxis protein
MAKKNIREKHGMGIRRKIICFLLPVIILFNFTSFVLTMSQTKKILREDAREMMQQTSDSVCYQISTDLQQTLGILENVRTSIQNFCTTTEEVQNYLFSVADAYPDRIPAGIYCGMTDGTYLDKCWQPDGDWVMTERPWYQEGLVSDDLTFGEMYMDANTNEYIISAYCNLKNTSGNVIGVLCADVQLDGVNELLRNASLYDQGYVYAVDEVTGIIMGNRNDEDQNGAILSELSDPLDQKVYEMMQNDQTDEIVLYQGTYILLNKIENTNFVTVCIVDKKDVESDMKSMQTSSIIINILGWIVICIAIYVILRILLNPIKGITGLIDRMYELDLTKRSTTNRKDEFGVMSGKMNLFADSLSGVIQNVKSAVSKVDSKADSNAGTASELSELAENQNQSIEALRETMYGISKAIEMIADGANELTAEIGSTNQAATTVGEMIEQTIQYVEDGHSEMENLTNTMSGISSFSEELQQSVLNLKDSLDGINALAGSVNDIAGQTNLLSLNASIEAARAGEAGRGFAVVAEEIRGLAANCAQAVENITTTTSGMNQLMEEVIRTTEQTRDRIYDGNKEVERSNTAFNRIEKNIAEMETAIHSVKSAVQNIEGVASDMASGTEEQSESTVRILNHCEQMIEISRQFRAEGQEMADSSQQLRELSEQLGDTISKFKI